MQIPGMIDFSSGDEAKAKVETDIAGQAQKFVQTQLVDPGMEKLGQNVAEKQGANFQNMPGFTEAQRAYNKSGNPIAASMLSTDLQTQANQYFLEAKQNGFPPDSAQTFQAKMQGWSDQTRNTQDPKLHALTIEGTNKLSSFYGRQIQAAQFKQQREQSSINLSNQYNQTTSNAMAFGNTNGTANPELLSPYYLQAQQYGEAQVKQGTFTAPQYVKGNTDFQKNFQMSMMQGDLNKMAQVLNNPHLTRAEHLDIISRIKNYPNRILGNPALQGPNIDLLQRRATTRGNEILNGIHVEAASSQLDANNLIATKRTGAPIDQSEWSISQSMLSESARLKNESRLNGAGHLHDTDVEARSLTASQNRAKATAIMPVEEDVMASQRPKLSKDMQAIYKNTANLQLHDPQIINAHNQGLLASQEHLITTLKPGNQKMVRMILANPGLSFSGKITPESMRAANKIWSQRSAASRLQGGPGYFMTNANAATMWSGISRLSPAEQNQQIIGWQHSMSPQNYSTFQNQIERNAHVGTDAFVSAYASTCPEVAVAHSVNQALAGDQMTSKEGKASQSQNEMLSGLTRSDVQTNMESDKLMNIHNVLDTFRGPLLAANRPNEYLGIRNIATSIFLNNKAHGKSDQIASQAVTSYLNANWAVVSKNRQNVLVPLHYTDDTGKTQRTKLSNVTGIMKNVLKYPSRYIKVAKNPKANVVQNESAINNYYNGIHWINTSSGGLRLVDAQHNVVMSKSGAALGFTVKNANDRMAMIDASEEKR